MFIKPQSNLTNIELAMTAAKCPALVHAFNFTTLEASGSNSILRDLVGTPVLALGLTALISNGPDIYSKSSSGSFLDASLSAGAWVQPTTKKIIVISMHGSTNVGNLIVGASAVAANADGLRVNRTAVNAFDFSALVTGTATVPAMTTSAAMTALRLTPGASINSIQTDSTTVTVNTQSVLTIPATIDGLSNVFTISTSVPYWGFIVLHCNNVPTDQAIAEAMTFMRPKWLTGNFVLAPTMLGWS